MSKVLTAGCMIALMVLILPSVGTSADVSCQQFYINIRIKGIIKSGTQILHEKDPRLHTSVFVQRTINKYKQTSGITLSRPTDKLNQWLDALTKISVKAESSPRILEQVKTILNNQFVIKPKEIPESYFELQKRLARERGYGDVKLNEAQKNKLSLQVITEQKKSLESWIEYLTSKDTSMYPMWIKYWMFTGMTRLSKFNVENGIFGNRDKGTTAPFPELNHEALGLVVDSVLKFYNRSSLEELNDPELQKLIPGMNFGKIYGRILFNLGEKNKSLFKTNQGKWVVYAQGSDHRPLVKSLEGQNTGWCTVGESTAKLQLDKGDFHVYYSLDDKGNPTIPRIAIRMEGNELAELRGVAADQNLDPQINQSTVVSEKMKEFGSKADMFRKKDHDMKMLNQIEVKHKNRIALNKEEIKFLYEVDSKIQGFGFGKDPRIEEIKLQREIKDDFVIVYDHKYTKDEISLTREEALSGKAKIHVGNLDLSDLTTVTGLKLPDIIDGNLNLSRLISAEGLKLPSIIKGNLSMDSLTSAKGIIFPNSLHSLSLGRLTSPAGLKLPEIINGSLELDSLTSAEGIVFPNNLRGLFLRGLTTPMGLKLPEIINGSLELNSLTSAEGLIFPKVLRSLYLSKLTTAKGLKLPEIINGNLELNSLVSVEGLKLPEKINGSLELNSLTTAEGLILPNALTGLSLVRLVTAKGLRLPDNFDGSLNISGLTSSDGLKLPNTLRSLSLKSLISAKGLKLPEIINGNLELNSLVSVEGLKLPEKINGRLELNSLISAEGLKFPDTLGGLLLSSLTTEVGLKLPETIKGFLDLRSLTSAKNLKRPRGVEIYQGPRDIQK